MHDASARRAARRCHQAGGCREGSRALRRKFEQSMAADPITYPRPSSGLPRRESRKNRGATASGKAPSPDLCTTRSGCYGAPGCAGSDATQTSWVRPARRQHYTAPGWTESAAMPRNTHAALSTSVVTKTSGATNAGLGDPWLPGPARRPTTRNELAILRREGFNERAGRLRVMRSGAAGLTACVLIG